MFFLTTVLEGSGEMRVGEAFFWDEAGDVLWVFRKAGEIWKLGIWEGGELIASTLGSS